LVLHMLRLRDYACWRFDGANIDRVQTGECDAGHSNMTVTSNRSEREKCPSVARQPLFRTA
jgi:hypothetical protein